MITPEGMIVIEADPATRPRLTPEEGRRVWDALYGLAGARDPLTGTLLPGYRRATRTASRPISVLADAMGHGTSGAHVTKGAP